MAQQHINLGTPPAALDGDSARAAFQKVQANFTELYGAGGSAANSAALNGLSGAADKAPYFTGAGAMSLATLTAFARTLLDDADAAAARTTLGAQPLDATLTALANLTLAANQMIYATGADAVATTALTAFARTLLDDADAAAARTTLGLGTASIANVQTSATDTTAGRALTVGAFGLGATALVISAGGDANNFIICGQFVYCQGSTTAHLPVPVTGYLHVTGMGDGNGGIRLCQEYTTAETTARKYFRSAVAGEWSEWREYLYRDSILGTVSQSSGVPTGAIIERGSNANGEYVRFADGTQICTRMSMTGDTTRSAYGTGLYQSANSAWTFPAVFAVAPSITGTAQDSSASALLLANTVTTTGCNLRSVSSASSVTSAALSPIAIGRWFQ